MSSEPKKANKNGRKKQQTPPRSPRKGWMKLGGKARSVENVPSLHRPGSPPLGVTSGNSSGETDYAIIPPPSPRDTPPSKMWEHNFRSFLSRKSQQDQPAATNFPPVPLIAPRQQLQQPQSQLPASKNDEENSVRGGKFFKSIFNSSTESQRRKTKSLNELDEPMRNGANKNFDPNGNNSGMSSSSNDNNNNNNSNNSNTSARFRKVQSHANVAMDENNDQLDQTLRRASLAGTSSGSVVPPPQPFGHYYQTHPQYNSLLQQQQQQQQFQQQQQQQLQTQSDHTLYGGHIPPGQRYSSHSPRHHPQHFQYNDPNLQRPPPQYSLSPNSAATEIKKAFTEFHNSSKYAVDTTSAYLGDEPSGRFSSFNPGLVVQNQFPPSAQANVRQVSTGCIGGNNNQRLLSSSLPTVDENVSIHKSMRMLRPFQTVDTWQTGRRYLIGPAALAACPLLNGISSLSLSAAHHTRDIYFGADENAVAKQDNGNEEEVAVMPSPQNLPPLFGCIILGKALLSYVIQEPLHRQQQRWWSSCMLVIRQNYLLEYDQQEGDLLQGLPRGYAHLQYATCYPHLDFVDALELEFFVSPCAKADRRVLTIRCEEAREKRDNWIVCLNRAARLNVKDLYDYDESVVLGRGRYAAVYPAIRRENASSREEAKESPVSNGKDTGCTHDNPLCSKACLDTYKCAIKLVDKKEFWKRVIKTRERSDTLVREISVQSTMTTKCAKIPNFVRIRGFFETSDVVLIELELLEGTDLFNYVSSKGVLSEKEAACILRDILTVLDCMNRAGLAHRDIKLANCLMCNCSSGGREKPPCGVKVGDFGMSTFVGVDGLVRGRCGTPGYCAPEVFSAGVHGGYSNKVDVFSAGVTLYVMLCGYEPFYGESDVELIAANKEAKLEFPSNDWKQVSSEAKDLVKRMMMADPNLRLSAKDALQHPWILQHTQSNDHGEVDGPNTPNGTSFSKESSSCIVM